MPIKFFLLTSFVALISSPALTQVNWPAERNLVGPDEYYTLEQFGDWTAQCIRDENAEDVCEAATMVEDLNAGLRFELAVLPYYSLEKSSADVDVAPRAYVSAYPYSSSPHYDDYSVAITKVDGQPYDAFWCPLTDDSECHRGPEISYSDLKLLMDARTVEVSVFTRDSAPGAYKLVKAFDVSFGYFAPSLRHALAFTGKVNGFDPDTIEFPVEMCTLDVKGPFDGQKKQARISYTYDEDFDLEQTTFREITFGPKGRGDCPSYVSLAFLAPEMTANQRKDFCLIYDKDNDLIAGLQNSEQDAYRTCVKPSKTACQMVNESKEAALSIAGFGAGVVGGVTGTATVTGTTVVAHSSGAWILTGSAGYVAKTLGTLGTAVMGVASAPVTIGATVLTVVAVGGAVYVCNG